MDHHRTSLPDESESDTTILVSSASSSIQIIPSDEDDDDFQRAVQESLRVSTSTSVVSSSSTTNHRFAGTGCNRPIKKDMSDQNQAFPLLPGETTKSNITEIYTSETTRKSFNIGPKQNRLQYNIDSELSVNANLRFNHVNKENETEQNKLPVPMDEDINERFYLGQYKFRLYAFEHPSHSLVHDTRNGRIERDYIRHKTDDPRLLVNNKLSIKYAAIFKSHYAYFLYILFEDSITLETETGTETVPKYVPYLFRIGVSDDYLGTSLLRLARNKYVQLTINLFTPFPSDASNAANNNVSQVIALNVDIHLNESLLLLESNEYSSTAFKVLSSDYLFVLSCFQIDLNVTDVQKVASKLDKTLLPKPPKLTEEDHYYIETGCYKDKVTKKRKQSDESDEDDVLNPVKQQQEQSSLFDLIYNYHKNSHSNREFFKYANGEALAEFQSQTGLIPELRPYQVNAVKWMLKREKYNSSLSTALSTQKSSILQQVDTNNSATTPKDKLSKASIVNGTLHPLFIKITNDRDQTIYHNRFYAVFSHTMPLKCDSLTGGILADEMGLGKTVEILAMIMMNRRQNIPKAILYKPESQAVADLTLKYGLKKKPVNIVQFSCFCGEKDFLTENNCIISTQPENPVYKCIKCKVYTHAECVSYTYEPEQFLCPHCLLTVEAFPSGCTLIVTPAVISHQWLDEIKKHVKKLADKKALKVFEYKGCGNTDQKFIQPRFLASMDVVLTTYEVLGNELNYVNAMINKRTFRQPQRFMNVPSPLVCVQFWRICLDEAQMVHSTNSKCADMASRLHAVNRWCVTGTPIGRSLSDLHGLFTFIKEDPYFEKKWFTSILYEPYKNGQREPMVAALANVLWRTSKKFVEDQIDIPTQTEKLYRLKFSPFEQHLYERVLEVFREQRQNNFIVSDKKRVKTAAILFDVTSDNNPSKSNVETFFKKYDKSLRLDEVDRAAIDQILAPLLDLRLTCNHPQLILQKNTFIAQTGDIRKEKLFTMEKSLQILLKKTKQECENIYRSLTMHNNAIAGFYIIQEKLDKAIEIYQHILNSQLEYEPRNIRIDRIQKIHTIFNLIYVVKTQIERGVGNETNELAAKSSSPKSVVAKRDYKQTSIEDLEKELKKCESHYILTFSEKKLENENKLKQKVKEIQKEINSSNTAWWINLVESIEKSATTKQDDFWERLSGKFEDHKVKPQKAVALKKPKKNSKITIEDYEDADSDASDSIKSSKKTRQDHTSAKRTRLDKSSDDEDNATATNVIQKRDKVIARQYLFAGKVIKSLPELKYLCIQETQILLTARLALIESFKVFHQNNENQASSSSSCSSVGITKKLVEHSARCHLRTEQEETRYLFEKEKCDLCKVNDKFTEYAKRLFSNNDEALSKVIRTTKASGFVGDVGVDEYGENNTLADEQHQTQLLVRLRSDIEIFFKFIHDTFKNDPKFVKELEIGKDFIKMYASFKEEFTMLRTYWTSISFLINAFDEIEMTKTRMRLLLPNEKVDAKLLYIIEPHMVETRLLEDLNRKKSSEMDLRKKLSQSLYLQNLLKTYIMMDGEENEELCTICQHNLGHEWYILLCGHSYCRECVLLLLKNENQHFNSHAISHVSQESVSVAHPSPYCPCELCREDFPSNNQHHYVERQLANRDLQKKKLKIRCPLCREESTYDEAYLVCTNKKAEEIKNRDESEKMKSSKQETAFDAFESTNELSNITIKGVCNSTKVEGVIRCLIQIIHKEKSAKCLIFSEYVTMLELIKKSLKENNIEYSYIKDAASAQKSLIEFKNNVDLNVLLMPYTFGANGLNLTEATHVLLVEPILNQSREFQAIGRVHRIGQTKRTTVHRFIVHNTIEELIYELFKGNSAYSLDHNQPTTSAAANAASLSTSSSDNQKRLISIADLQKLFLNL